MVPVFVTLHLPRWDLGTMLFVVPWQTWVLLPVQVTLKLLIHILIRVLQTRPGVQHVTLNSSNDSEFPDSVLLNSWVSWVHSRPSLGKHVSPFVSFPFLS